MFPFEIHTPSIPRLVELSSNVAAAMEEGDFHTLHRAADSVLVEGNLTAPWQGQLRAGYAQLFVEIDAVFLADMQQASTGTVAQKE